MLLLWLVPPPPPPLLLSLVGPPHLLLPPPPLPVDGPVIAVAELAAGPFPVLLLPLLRPAPAGLILPSQVPPPAAPLLPVLLSDAPLLAPP